MGINCRANRTKVERVWGGFALPSQKDTSTLYLITTKSLKFSIAFFASPDSLCSIVPELTSISSKAFV